MKYFNTEMVRLSYFDYKVFLAILKLIDNNQDINTDQLGDYIQTFSVDEVYNFIGLEPGLHRKTEKRRMLVSTLNTISKMTFIKIKDGAVVKKTFL